MCEKRKVKKRILTQTTKDKEDAIFIDAFVVIEDHSGITAAEHIEENAVEGVGVNGASEVAIEGVVDEEWRSKTESGGEAIGSWGGDQGDHSRRAIQVGFQSELNQD